MTFTVGLGQLVITFGYDDILAFMIVGLMVAVSLHLRRNRAFAPSIGTNNLAAVSVVRDLSDNEPKPLRYGSGKLEGGAWEATGPGYLPDPDPLVGFDLKSASVRDYVYVNKTLRYPYFQTMSHQPMHINDWIEIDNEYVWYLDEKARVIREQGKVVIDSLPENDDACTELLETLADYLPKRFPTLFQSIPVDPAKTPMKPSGYGKSVGIVNKVTGERFENVQELKGTDALLVVSRLVQDDFLMARERDDGKSYLVGGLIVFPGSYLLSEKINQPLHEIHAPVPNIKKMMMSIERTMARFSPDRPFERSSWMIVDDRELFWHNIISNTMPEDMHPKDLFLRIDHQTFRKLPRSKGVVFGVHPVLKKIGDLADSPLVPALMAKIHTDANDELMEYKKSEKYCGRLLPYLRELTEQQVAKGLVEAKDVADVAKFREHIREVDNHN
ncbi:uncharacterized protein FIBRA_06070 [Fibroporia radiculosa]|uniref:Uncharacterized protein n=1 Tax=Fibroporia radiculosa TaxID=599839 RepID=J4H3V8_9APHY|nr:uncharacterized protein FIBRA_06070 [Fibroporia radiculosa]CCM03919.1 predicted protein [Fibroporia radiculosa]